MTNINLRRDMVSWLKVETLTLDRPGHDVCPCNLGAVCVGALLHTSVSTSRKWEEDVPHRVVCDFPIYATWETLVVFCLFLIRN